MYQGGVLKVTLFENKGVNFFYFDPTNERRVTNLTSSGFNIEILNEQLPDFGFTSRLGGNGRITYEYSLSFHVMGDTQDNASTIAQLAHSTYGFIALVEYYDGTIKLYNAPLFFDRSKIEMQKEQAFEVSMQSRVPTYERFYLYSEGQSSLVSYKFDTEVLTWDSEIYTFDYDL